MAWRPQIAVFVTAALALGVWASGALGAVGGGDVTPVAPCGPATATTVVQTDLEVARRIFVGEQRGPALQADVRRVMSAGDLLRALVRHDQAATLAAVKRLVYRPHWHIVRLRVSAGGRVLADVGGPHVLAPVSGTLTVAGRAVGRFVMSVQDDVGYRKLETRFIGVPVELYQGGRPITGTLARAPSTAPLDGTSVVEGGVRFQTAELAATAFPEGALRVVLFIPAPRAQLTLASCAEVSASVTARIAARIAARFTPLQQHYPQFVIAATSFTHAQVFVRVDTLQLAGTAAPGPVPLPERGTVTYDGVLWAVASVEPAPPARIYVLVPAG